MKRCVPFMFAVAVTLQCWAKDLALQDGKILKDARLLRRYDRTVSIAHENGGGIFPLSDFTPDDRKWIQANETYQTFNGQRIATNSASFVLGSEIASRVSAYTSLRTLMGTRIDNLLTDKPITVPQSSHMIVAIRRQLLKDKYVTWQFDEHFGDILEHLKSPFGKELVRIDRTICRERENLVDDFIKNHPQMFKGYGERLRYKSRSTGLFQLEVRAILDELEPLLAPGHEKILAEHLTDKDIREYNEFKKTPAWREMEQMALRVEYQIIDIARKHDLFRPGSDSEDPSMVDLLVRFKIAKISETYGIQIHFETANKGFFPDKWHAPPCSVKAVTAEPYAVLVALDLIEDFMKTYPARLIRNNLSDIYLVRTLKLWGKQYGGTYVGSAVYIALEHRPARALNTLHHEFSHILTGNYAFPFEEWKKINDPDWKYFGSGYDMLGQPGLNEQTEELLAQGFLSRYSTSSVKEDVNVMIEWVTCEQEPLKALAMKYDRIHRKAELLKKFYRDVRSNRLKRVRPISIRCRRHVYVDPSH